MPWIKQFDVTEVLEKALMEFWRKGFHATSVQDLVECTGINRASLYATFGDKRTFFIKALDSYDNNRRTLFTRLETEYGPIDAIRQLFMVNIEPALCGKELRGCFMANTALELSTHDEEIGAIVEQAHNEMETFFLRNLKRGKDEGLVENDLDCHEKAKGLLSSLLGLLVLVRSRPEPDLLIAVVHEALGKIVPL